MRHGPERGDHVGRRVPARDAALERAHDQAVGGDRERGDPLVVLHRRHPR